MEIGKEAPRMETADQKTHLAWIRKYRTYWFLGHWCRTGLLGKSELRDLSKVIRFFITYKAGSLGLSPKLSGFFFFVELIGGSGFCIGKLMFY